MTEKEKFLIRLGNARDAGLMDVKFFFRPRRPMKPEDIFQSLNQIEDAIKANQCIRHSGWDGDNPRSGS